MNNKHYTNDLNYDINNNDDEYEPCSKKLLPSLFAWFLLISSTSSYFTLVFPLFYDIIGQNRFYLFILLAAFHGILFFYVLVNFSIATFMDPGRFPKVDIADNGEGVIKPLSSTNYKNVLINDINVRMKWCTTCQFYRPPRSSHCAVCNTCIDTMDHHCPWVSNCIGRRNYKYFFSFLVSLTLHMLAILSLCVTLVLLNKDNLANIPMLAAILLIILISILIIPIGGLTGFHIILVSRGRTTNEQVTGKFRTGVNPFDEGVSINCAKILFSSTPPSYMKFRRKQIQMREYYRAKILLNKYSIKSKCDKNLKNGGQIIKGGNSAKILTPHKYKNPNFHANKIHENSKRIRKYQVNNHHLQNELELKFHNYLNQEESQTANFIVKNEFETKPSQNNINNCNNGANKHYTTNYDNQFIIQQAQLQYQIDHQNKMPKNNKKNSKKHLNLSEPVKNQKYTRNNSYTNANQFVENVKLIPDDHNRNGLALSTTTTATSREYLNSKSKLKHQQQNSNNNSNNNNNNKKYNNINNRDNSSNVNYDDRSDYNSYEITV